MHGYVVDFGHDKKKKSRKNRLLDIIYLFIFIDF
nr:MAG TPA: hypothetical protein [Caudoviricetes sp.]